MTFDQEAISRLHFADGNRPHDDDAIGVHVDLIECSEFVLDDVDD